MQIKYDRSNVELTLVWQAYEIEIIMYIFVYYVINMKIIQYLMYRYPIQAFANFPNGPRRYYPCHKVCVICKLDEWVDNMLSVRNPDGTHVTNDDVDPHTSEPIVYINDWSVLYLWYHHNVTLPLTAYIGCMYFLVPCFWF